MPDKKLPAVPETILKKRKRQAESRALRAKEALKSKITKKVCYDTSLKSSNQTICPFSLSLNIVFVGWLHD